MGRLLDENDVIDWLLKRTEMYDATGHFVDKNVVKKNIESQIAKIPSAQPDLSEYSDKLWRNAYERGKRDAQPEQQWIPCSERLPEDVQIGEEYPLVIFCTKDATYAGFYEYYLGGRWWSDSDYVVDGVIAWMPLPEPYEGGNDV